jgi:hypothetical protein
MPLLAHGEFLAGPAWVIGVLCFAAVCAGIAYCVLKDTFRLGRRNVAVSAGVATIALLTALAFWFGQYTGLLVAPVLGLAYGLGHHQARKDAAARQPGLPFEGGTCRVCEKKIVFANEAGFCRRCKAFVHLACEPAGVCDRCGEIHERYEPATVHPVEDAIIPRALRPATSGAPALAVLMVFLAMLVVLYLMMLT